MCGAVSGVVWCGVCGAGVGVGVCGCVDVVWKHGMPDKKERRICQYITLQQSRAGQDRVDGINV